MDTPLWQTVFGTLAALGGGGGIIFAFSGMLGKIWTDRIAEQLRQTNSIDLGRIKAEFIHDIESYKIQLKKSEFIFQKQFEATSALVALIRKIIPRYSSPHMTWNEAYEQIALNFSAIELQLDEYLATHGAVLPIPVRETIISSLADVGSYQFEATPEEVSGSALEAAEAIVKNLQNIQQEMINLVHGQSSL